jgi:hypothetical protein
MYQRPAVVRFPQSAVPDKLLLSSFFLSGVNSTVLHVQVSGIAVKGSYRGVEFWKIPRSIDKIIPLSGGLAFDSVFFDFFPFPVVSGFGDFSMFMINGMY